MKIIYQSIRKEDFLSELWKAKIQRYLRRANNRLSKERGHKMVVYANDFISVQIFTDGIFERTHLETLQGFLDNLLGDRKKNLAVLDIGANIGNHSLFFARHFGQVFAFEPHPFTYQLLALNSQFAPNLKTFNLGLGDKEDTLDLYEDNSNFGASSMIHQVNQEGKKIQVDIKRLDDMSLGQTPIGLMKIDVEGMEYHVLLGAQALIKEHQPIIILEQLENEFQGDSQETPSISVLRNLGYNFCWIKRKPNKPFWLTLGIPQLLNLFRKRKIIYDIITDKVVPKATYDMLIALPPKYSAIL